jgi:hypothetical protein
MEMEQNKMNNINIDEHASVVILSCCECKTYVHCKIPGVRTAQGHLCAALRSSMGTLRITQASPDR